MVASLAIHALFVLHVRNEFSPPAPATGLTEIGIELVAASLDGASLARAEPARVAAAHALPDSGTLPHEASHAEEAAGRSPGQSITADQAAKESDIEAVSESETSSPPLRGAVMRADADGSAKDNERRLDLVQSRLEASKFYPASARRRGIEGEVELSFALNSEGLADNILILAGSGYSVLDRAAMQTVHRAQPFPIFDGEYRVRLRFSQL